MESRTLETGITGGATASYTLTHMHILTQGLAVTGPEDVENVGKHLRPGSCDQLGPKGDARSCPLDRLMLVEVCEGVEQICVWVMLSAHVFFTNIDMAFCSFCGCLSKLSRVMTGAFLCMLGIWHSFQICHCFSRDLAHLFPSPSFLSLHQVDGRIIVSLRKDLAYWMNRSLLLSSQHGCRVCPEK